MANVYKDKKKGTYYYVASLGFDDVTGKRIQKLKRGFNTRKEAVQAYNELMNDYGKMAFKTNSTMSYGEYFESIFLPWYQGRVKERTYQNRLSSMQIHFKPFYKKKVSAITPILIQKWQNELMKIMSNAYVRNIYGLFSMSLERAYKLGMIPQNPAKTVGNVKKVKAAVDFWTKAEFEQILSTFDRNDYYEHFSFMVLWLFFMTGMRFGEAQALQWETDIQFDEKTLSISKSMFYKNAKEFYVVETKTRASKRLVALDDTTISYLREWQAIQQKNIQGTTYVLSYNGLPTNKHTVRHIIHRHAELAGIHPIRIHGLRHSHASLLISMGENPLIIKDRLGHEDIKTTLGTYGHLYPNMNREVATKLTHVLVWKQNKEIEEKKKPFRATNISRKREWNMAEWKMKDFDLVGQLGRELLLVEVSPKPKYEKNEVTGKNERTGEIDGYTYELLMKDKKYKSIRVSVSSSEPIITQSELDKAGETFVTLEGVNCNPYVQNGFIALSFKAEGISIKKKQPA